MTRSTILVGLATLGVAAGASLIYAGAASAHTAGYTLTPGPCVAAQGGMWTATVDIAGTYLELSPVARIDSPGSGLELPVPGSHTFSTAFETFTVDVRVTWSDGFVAELGRQTVTRPTDCPTPTPQAPVPPPMDTVPATVPEVSTVPPVAVTIAPTTTVAAAPPPSMASTAPPGVPSTLTPAVLPATGNDGRLLIVKPALGALLVLVGLMMVTVKRRAKP